MIQIQLSKINRIKSAAAFHYGGEEFTIGAAQSPE